MKSLSTAAARNLATTTKIPLLVGLDDDTALAALATAFAQQQVEGGFVLAERGQPAASGLMA